MAGIDLWRLCQGEIRLAFPQRTALGLGEEGGGRVRWGMGEDEEDGDSLQPDGGRRPLVQTISTFGFTLLWRFEQWK